MGYTKLDNNKIIEELTNALEQKLESVEANAAVVVLLRIENQEFRFCL